MLSAIEGQKDRILELSGNIHLFSSLTNQELRQIVGQIVVKTFKKGDVMILRGKVKVIQTTEELLQILCSRLRDSWGKIQILSFSNASQRLRMLFLGLSSEYGKQIDAGTRFPIRLTHQDIANMVGISRETVTRVIDRWQKDGEIEFPKGKYILLREKFYQCERG